MVAKSSEGHTLWDRGLARLESWSARDGELEVWRERLRNWRLSPDPHDLMVWYTCVLALESVNEGNFGVGAVIVRDGEVVAEGRNQAFRPNIRGAYHAEARALEAYESNTNTSGDVSDMTMFSSLECCPMCTVLLINSGIRNVYYAAPDPSCGMLSRWEQLPPGYRTLAARRIPPQSFGSASCSDSLVKCAMTIFSLNEESLSAAMAAR